jgi:hypothetical protein
MQASVTRVQRRGVSLRWYSKYCMWVSRGSPSRYFLGTIKMGVFQVPSRASPADPHTILTSRCCTIVVFAVGPQHTAENKGGNNSRSNLKANPDRDVSAVAP